ncbi:hypothetical protein [Fodinibius sp. Rm-B-1B1-1]|uniref:hypothetical protein n=1 Tax=Fodinibius alkaliphilus TaxID=3140241 RepID=UPI003159C2D2
MKPIPNFAILFLAFSVLTSSCSVFSAEEENPTVQFSSSPQHDKLLNEGRIKIQVGESSQEITLTDNQPKSQNKTVPSGTFSFAFSFSKYDTTKPISQGNAKIDLEVDKNYSISFGSWKVDTTSEDYLSYGGCFECLKFKSFSINHSALDSTSSLFHHRLLITFFD